jgi:hypothetical protein
MFSTYATKLYVTKMKFFSGERDFLRRGGMLAKVCSICEDQAAHVSLILNSNLCREMSQMEEEARRKGLNVRVRNAEPYREFQNTEDNDRSENTQSLHIP